MFRKITVFSLVLATTFSASVALAQAPELAPVGNPGIFRHQNIERKYLEYIPQDGKTGPRPVLLYLHGVRPLDWKNWIPPERKAIADREGIIILNPEAIGFRWNYAAPEALISAAQKAGDEIADDVGFIVGLIDHKVVAGLADPARIYVTGDSRGGMMAFELMCKASGKIAAVGPMIGSMMEKQLAACNPERPVPLMAINGTMDDNIFYDGWILNGKRQLSTPEVMEFWRLRHGCTGQKGDPIKKREGVTGDRTGIWKITWTGCTQEEAVQLYRVNGGGHFTPNLRPPTDREGRRRNQDVEAIEEFWKFASKFRR